MRVYAYVRHYFRCHDVVSHSVTDAMPLLLFVIAAADARVDAAPLLLLCCRC